MSRAETIERIIKLIWDSLDSHLPYTYTKHEDGEDFHKLCVKEYIEIMRLVATLY